MRVHHFCPVRILAKLDSGLLQRHLSFIENGRSIPSRRTLLEIARALEIPFRDRNTLLLSAGLQ